LKDKKDLQRSQFLVLEDREKLAKQIQSNIELQETTVDSDVDGFLFGKDSGEEPEHSEDNSKNTAEDDLSPTA
jgi:muramoyltetrapeptide carboxypeptidase LdcA involved in peptidoglycan recycling